MLDYKKMYFRLFNDMSRAIEALEHNNFGQAAEILKQAQLEGEEAYMSDEEA